MRGYIGFSRMAVRSDSGLNIFAKLRNICQLTKENFILVGKGCNFGRS